MKRNKQKKLEDCIEDFISLFPYYDKETVLLLMKDLNQISAVWVMFNKITSELKPGELSKQEDSHGSENTGSDNTGKT